MLVVWSARPRCLVDDANDELSSLLLEISSRPVSKFLEIERLECQNPEIILDGWEKVFSEFLKAKEHWLLVIKLKRCTYYVYKNVFDVPFLVSVIA